MPTIAVTLGAAGCAACHQGRTELCAAHSVDAIVDTTGASDAFTAALALGVCSGLPLYQATQRALAAAAHAITMPGGYESMPSAQDLDRALAASSEQADPIHRADRTAD
ncbi:PfkB family carbohydrate kinase [Nocardia brasiliensis]|uniref:PfkB family carbohydrate kinase n=1 Tax=Nocardia brasiliensis TaxID=37326 RepID=UPI003CC7F07C